MYPPSERYVFIRTAASKFLIAASGTISASLGLMVLIGWYAHMAALVQLRLYLAPMQYNAALCMLISGAGLCAFSGRQLRLAQVLGGMVTILAGVTVCEYLWGSDHGIDQLFFRAYINTQTSHPERMSPASALCLLQIGLALLLMGIRLQWKWKTMVIGSMGAVVVAICAAAILGYAIDFPETYGWGQHTRLALHSAIGLLFLGLGIFAAAWSDGRRGDELTPRWLPLSVACGVLATSLVFSRAVGSKQNQGMAQSIKASAEGVGNIINLGMEARIRSLQRMAVHWELDGHLSQAAWESDAKNFARDFPDFRAMEWIDFSHVVRWTAPPAGNTAGTKQNIVLETKRRTAVKMARQSQGPVVTGMVELSKGIPGFIICIPIYTGKKFEGCVAGMFEAQALFEHYLPATVASGYAIAISEGDRTFYERYPSPEPANKDWVSNSSLTQGVTTWNVRVWPVPALAAKMDSSLPETLLLTGLMRAALLGMIMYLAQKSSAQARKTALLNNELQTALVEVRTLSGMLPICAGCKRIRDDGGYWSQIERYLSKHSEASFSHGICPECAKSFYEEGGMEVPEDILKAIETHACD